MKKNIYFVLLSLLLSFSVIIAGCGGGNSGSGNNNNGGDGLETGSGWLVGTWSGTIPARPEGYGEGDGPFEGYPISITIAADPVKISGKESYSYSGTVSFNGITYSFSKSKDFDPKQSSLVWVPMAPSITLLAIGKECDFINLWTTEEVTPSITPTTLKLDWYIQLSLEENDSNSGIENYYITLIKK